MELTKLERISNIISIDVRKYKYGNGGGGGLVDSNLAIYSDNPNSTFLMR